MKKFLIILLLIIAIGAGAFLAVTKFFPKEEEEAVVEAPPAEIVYKLVSVERVSELPGGLSPQQAANEFLVITVKGTNYDVKTRLFNVFYFSFEDAEGKVYQNALNTKPDSLRYGTLDPDQNNPVVGSIVFEVPKDSTGELHVSDEKNNPVQTLKIK